MQGDKISHFQLLNFFHKYRFSETNSPALISRGLSHNNTAEIQEQTPSPGKGQGARPKVRSNFTNLPPQDIGRPLQFSGGQSDLTSPSARKGPIGHQQHPVDQSTNKRGALRESGSESALSDLQLQEVLRPRDVRKERSPSSQATHLKDYVSPVNSSLIGDINVSGIKDIRSGAVKRHSAFELYPQRSSHLQSDQSPAGNGFKQNKRAHELDRDPFEDIPHSTGIEEDHDPFANLTRRIGSDTDVNNVFDSRDLPHLPAGFHRRNDSLEHLRDDVPHEQNIDSIVVGIHSHDEFSATSDLYQTGQDNSFNLSDTEMTMTIKDNTQRVTPDGSVENRYRNTGSIGQQPRPIDIERNDCDNINSSSRNYDNTSANVNLNYQSSGKLKTDSAAPYQVLAHSFSFFFHKKR